MAFLKLLKRAVRNYSNLASKPQQVQIHKPDLITPEQFAAFRNSLSSVVDRTLSQDFYKQLPEVTNRLRRIIDYNVPGGKHLRGAITLFTYKTLEKQELSQESFRDACVLSWVIEMLQSYYLILDDLEDGSKMRRGKPCWYLLPDVGSKAVYDADLLRNFTNQILKQNLEDKPMYKDILHLFHEGFLNTTIGQYLDDTMNKINKNSTHNFSHFTVEQYNKIVHYKTSFYTVKLPMLLGITLANKHSEETYKIVDDIGNDMGKLFQMQDDYIDCFGEAKLSGKIGSDIQEGKCTWLASHALERCSQNQRNVFTACYGSQQPAHIERVVQLYRQLGLQNLYQEQEKTLYEKIIQKSRAYAGPLPPELFKKVVESFYQRKS